MPRPHDGPRPFGRLRHTGNVGLSFGGAPPAKWAELDRSEKFFEEERAKLREERAQEERRKLAEDRLLGDFRRQIEAPLALGCLHVLARVRWPNGVTCPSCGRRDVERCTIDVGRRTFFEWHCCGTRFDATTGTRLQALGFQRATLSVVFRAAFIIVWHGKMSFDRFRTLLRIYDDDKAEHILRVVTTLLDRSPDPDLRKKDANLLDRIAFAFLHNER